MKIEFGKPIGIPSAPDAVRSKETPSSGATFSELLNSAMKEQKASETVLDPPLIQSAYPIGSELSIDSGKVAVTHGIEKMLDSLETYGKLLSSPTSSLRAMAPLVDRIEIEANSLSSSAASLSENDPLKEILLQTLVTANVEIARFHRGDYVPV